MVHDWQELTQLVGDQEIAISKVLIPETGIQIEGTFELPPLAKLKYEDQLFVYSFIKVHGSIKELEQIFGISYPTVKNRLNAIIAKLKPDFDHLSSANFVSSKLYQSSIDRKSEKQKVLSRLERGELTPNQAIEELNRL